MAYGFKLFEENARGVLFPLFIGAKNPVSMGEWIHAEFLPTKGFSPRGGWHLGALVPSAWWLMSKDRTYKSRRFKHGRRVWCLCEYNSHTNYNTLVADLPKHCICNGIPENGFYNFREPGKGEWVISSDIRVIRRVEEEERQEILNAAGYDEIGAFIKYREPKKSRKCE